MLEVKGGFWPANRVGNQILGNTECNMATMVGNSITRAIIEMRRKKMDRLRFYVATYLGDKNTL